MDKKESTSKNADNILNEDEVKANVTEEATSSTPIEVKSKDYTGNSKAVIYFLSAIFFILLSFLSGIFGAYLVVGDISEGGQVGERISNVTITNEESPIIEVAENVSPSVVSVVITQMVPQYRNFGIWGLQREQVGETERQVGAGTGFIISDDGLIITNRHVVEEDDAEYTVILNDGTEIEAEVMARDSVLDIAILKVDGSDIDLTPVNLGKSSELKVGQSVIAIGNSLGEFSNTVSTGIVSGLGRTIVASDQSGRGVQRLRDVIQTDASINPGNSGGPLLDINGNVIGVNVAVAQSAENIGFSIPIDSVMPIVDSVLEFGEIRRAQLGVRYIEVNELLAEQRGLDANYGALLEGTENSPAVLEGSAAAEAGLRAGDLVVDINGVELKESTLAEEIQKYNVGDEISISYYRNGELIEVDVILGVAEN
jgi:serine protease Do